jgi:hypothetical protein
MILIGGELAEYQLELCDWPVPLQRMTVQVISVD